MLYDFYSTYVHFSVSTVDTIQAVFSPAPCVPTDVFGNTSKPRTSSLHTISRTCVRAPTIKSDARRPPETTQNDVRGVKKARARIVFLRDVSAAAAVAVVAIRRRRFCSPAAAHARQKRRDRRRNRVCVNLHSV